MCMTQAYGDVRVLILAGGSGTRLWPLSTDQTPKPFLPLAGGKSLLEETARRAERLVPSSAVFFSARDAHLPLLSTVFPGVDPSRFILEPERRNTAPAIGLSTVILGEEDPEALIVVLPSDQAVTDEAVFEKSLRWAIDAAREQGVFVTLGIPPVRPETGFGYLETDPLESELPVRRVVRFVEKPPLETARTYLESGRFFWNAGIFVFKVKALLKAMETHCPDLLEAVQEAACKRRKGDDEGFRNAFGRARKTSIDYAVMEKVTGVLTVPCSCGWSDLGSWDAVWDFRQTVSQDNIFAGPVEASASSGCLALAGERPITLIGVSDLVVVDSSQGLLVTRRGASDLLRDFVEKKLAQGSR